MSAAWEEHYRTYRNEPHHIAVRKVLRERLVIALERKAERDEEG